MTARPAMAALHGRIARYYTAKIERHDATPAGVDWPSARAQELRFAQLLRVCDFGAPLTLDDIGCGYGALLGHIERTAPATTVDYLGVDLSPAMVSRARRLWSDRPTAAFEVGNRSPRTADYSVASGIFNVRIAEPLELWERFVADTLRSMAAGTRHGFAVNFLKPLPRGTDTVPELYRPPRGRWSAFCESELGRTVSVVDGYGLREITLLVRS